VEQGVALPLDGPLIAYEAGSAENKTLLLGDPKEGISYEFRLPATARFATPFLAGLSPDTRYFVTFEGGWLETLYEIEHLRASKADLKLHMLELGSGELIFSADLLSPSFPQDLAQIAETIKDEWHFTSQNASFKDVVAATQEFMLDHIRRVAWSPDGSLLAFASQDPGPSSDLYTFSPESGTAEPVSTDPGHVVRVVWAPDSSTLVMDTSLYDRHAREDTTTVLSRDGSTLASFTSQVLFFHHWHDSTWAILYGATDSGDQFEPQAISTTDGTTTLLWDRSFADIAFSPDLSTFLLASSMPSAPAPPCPGLFLGRLEDGSLLTLSEGNRGWGVAYWGSARFAFAASSIEEGTIGVTPDGERVTIDEGVWKLAASPNGGYLAGYHKYHPSYLPGIVPGLRVFDGTGELLESVEDINVTCVGWNAASTALAYQVERRLYLWDAAPGSTRLVSDQLNEKACSFKWVRDRGRLVLFTPRITQVDRLGDRVAKVME
jgi:WD40 repeat protein